MNPIFQGWLPVLTICAVLIGAWASIVGIVLYQGRQFDRRLDDLRSEMNHRFDDLRDWLRSEFRRLEDRIERLEHPVSKP